MKKDKSGQLDSAGGSITKTKQETTIIYWWRANPSLASDQDLCHCASFSNFYFSLFSIPFLIILFPFISTVSTTRHLNPIEGYWIGHLPSLAIVELTQQSKATFPTPAASSAGAQEPPLPPIVPASFNRRTQHDLASFLSGHSTRATNAYAGLPESN